MSNSQATLLNKKRRAIRARMARDAKNYASASAKLLVSLEKLSKEDLSAFLKKNPDVLIDIAGGVLAKVGSRAKNAAKVVLHEFKNDFSRTKTKGALRAGAFGAGLEKKGIAYLKKLLSF